MAVVVFVNPGSRANRKDPSFVNRFEEILGSQGRVAAPTGLDQLSEEAQRVAAELPSIIGIHGGDGTLQRTLTALIRAYQGRPLPPIAVLPGGTMNVVASSLDIRVKAERVLAELVAKERAGQTPATIRRRCLRVGDNYGFIFGSGLLHNFLEEYYARGNYGAWRAIWVLLRTVLSLVTTRRYAQRIFRRIRGVVKVDGAVLPYPSLTALGAATVTEIGFRFKLHHLADRDPERMGAVAIHCRPLSLLFDILSVRLGRGISPKRATSFAADRIDIQLLAPLTAYTLDGDMYGSQGPLTVEVGPALQIVKPDAR